jgi:hypothetical protein
VNLDVNEFEFGRDGYGRIRGSDGIFSVHPFDPSSISYNGYGAPVTMNGRLVAAGLVERYDRAKHPIRVYQKVLALRE